MKPVIYQLLVRLAGNRNKSIKPFGTIAENGCGKFKDLDDHFLKSLRQFGITHLWLTGVLEHATCTDYSDHGIKPDNALVVKGRAGSPYAIKDYYDVCPDLAVSVENRMQEFEALVARCNDAGLKPIIDFVPNHLARQYHSDQKPEGVDDIGNKDNQQAAFSPANNFYYLPGQSLKLPPEVYQLTYVLELNPQPYDESPAKATGNDQFKPILLFSDWYETVKLNYGIDYLNDRTKHFDPLPDTWEKMLEILLFWSSKGIAGFRCDMAEMVPVEFWEWAIKRVKNKHRHIIFIAEIYNPRAYREYIEKGGFDYLYDKDGFYDTMRLILTGKKPAASLTEVWQNLNGLDKYMLRFLENHDEQRLASRFFAGYPQPGIPAMAVAATMHQGPVMIYFGQEMGEPAQGKAGFSDDDGRTTIFDYFHVPAFQKWFNDGKCNNEYLTPDQVSLRKEYTRILKLCQHRVIQSGEFYDLMWFNKHSEEFDTNKIFAFLRWKQSEIWLIAANFSSEKTKKFKIRIPEHFFELAKINSEKNFSLKPIVYQSDLPGKMSLMDLAAKGMDLVIEPHNYVVTALS